MHFRYFSPIRTNEVIGHPEQRERINAAADTALADLARLREARSTTFEDYIAVAKRFAIDSELLRDDAVRQSIALAEAAGGAASMIMLGNAVFATVPFSGSREIRLSSNRVRVLR